MDLELGGTTAVVIGAARGIGRAVADAFAAEGASVVVVDRDAVVREVSRAIEEDTARPALAFEADVMDLAALERVAERTVEERGGFDHVVSAVGIGSGEFGFPFWNVSPESWSKVLDVNLRGVVHVGHAFAPHLVAKKSGSLLFFSSVAGQIGSQTDPPYSAAKAGVINFAQCAAKDLAPHRVRVNCLCPGMVKTELNRSVWEAWRRRQNDADPPDYEAWAAEKIAEVVPLGRWQEAAEVAAMAVFLASPRSRSITGQTINVDGGYVMHW